MRDLLGQVGSDHLSAYWVVEILMLVECLLGDLRSVCTALVHRAVHWASKLHAALASDHLNHLKH